MATPLVNTYTGSTATIALLQPTVSWAQVRADKDRLLHFQALLTQNAELKQTQAEQATAATQQAIGALREVEFLDQDKNRWQDFVDGMLSENQKRIDKEYGNDLERYGRERYKQDTQNLILKATKSPLFRESLERRSNYIRLVADQSKGLIDRPVTYRMTDGMIKTASATHNFLDFQVGKTIDFKYNGGYADPQK
ncbi:hypothetical protein GCM10027341_27250 [Spirosoma knui]